VNFDYRVIVISSQGTCRLEVCRICILRKRWKISPDINLECTAMGVAWSMRSSLCFVFTCSSIIYASLTGFLLVTLFLLFTGLEQCGRCLNQYLHTFNLLNHVSVLTCISGSEY
jgi:hypothetical protein